MRISRDVPTLVISELPFAAHDIETADHLSDRLASVKRAGEMERQRALNEVIHALQRRIDERESELENTWETSPIDSVDSDVGCNAEVPPEVADEATSAKLTLYDNHEVKRQLDAELPHSDNGLENYLEALAKPNANQFNYVGSTTESIRKLDRLLDQFPNFRLATEVVIGAAKLSLQSATPLRLPKFLLDGPPGIGKTEWTRALCEALDLPLVTISMGSLDGRFELAGGHRTYKGAEPSLLIKGLLKAGVANPLLLFDEAELARPDLYQPLYQFIEDEYFTDHFLEIPFLVAHVNVFLITNDRTQLPDAIRSRTCELVIEEPSTLERDAIIARIYNHLRTTHAEYHVFPATLNLLCLERLQRLSLRQVRIGLEVAMLRSIGTADTDEIATVNPEFILDARATQKSPIGFVH